MEVKTKKTLVASNGKEFGIGQDIGFCINSVKSKAICIGEIQEITDTTITLGNVEFGGQKLQGVVMTIRIDSINDSSCDYVFCD